MLLCEEQKREKYLKKKKINYLVKLMQSDKFGNIKMTIGEQLKKAAELRTRLIEIYTVLKFEKEQPLKDDINLSNLPLPRYANSFSRFFLNYKDKKDCLISIVEDYSVESIT